MWPDRVPNPGSLTYESGALPTGLRGPARLLVYNESLCYTIYVWVYFEFGWGFLTIFSLLKKKTTTDLKVLNVQISSSYFLTSVFIFPVHAVY